MIEGNFLGVDQMSSFDEDIGSLGFVDFLQTENDLLFIDQQF